MRPKPHPGVMGNFRKSSITLNLSDANMGVAAFQQGSLIATEGLS